MVKKIRKYLKSISNCLNNYFLEDDPYNGPNSQLLFILILALILGFIVWFRNSIILPILIALFLIILFLKYHSKKK